jgi:hypothetical protein
MGPIPPAFKTPAGFWEDDNIRHPQDVGFILVMLGFLVQWPTILTLAMFSVLVWMYVPQSAGSKANAKAAAIRRQAAVWGHRGQALQRAPRPGLG